MLTPSELTPTTTDVISGENTASGSVRTTEPPVIGQIAPELDITSPSPYDNSLSFLYKQAVRMGIPYRFLLVHPKTNLDNRFIDTFDLEDNRDATFTSLIQFVRQLVMGDKDITLIQIWDIISKFKGDTYNPLDLISIYIHAVPEHRIEHIDILNKINNYLSDLKENTQFNSVADVVNYYNLVWLPRYNQELLHDRNTLISYVRAQQEISEIQPVYHSGISLDSVIISYDYPAEPGINLLPDIFNTAVTDYVVPFIQYNIRPVKGQPENIERYYKIYKGRSIDSRPDYNNVKLDSSQTPRGQTIYMNVWAGEDFYDEEFQRETSDVYEEARTGKKESFNLITVTYIEDQNLMRVLFSSPQTETVDKNTLIRRIHSHIPGLPAPRREAINELRISGSFMIYGIDLIEATLFHLIMNDPLFSAYLYLEEGGKSFAEKTRLNIHYRGASADLGESQKSYKTDNKKRKIKKRSAVSATINYEIIGAGDKYLVQRPDGTEIAASNPQSFSAIRVKMTRATSRHVAQQFVDVLSRLFRRYCVSHNILNMYLYYVPEYAAVLNMKSQQRSHTSGVPLSTEGGKVIDNQVSRIDILRKNAADIFVPNYARKCQRPFQPKLINPNEAAIWQQKAIIRGSSQEQRQIMLFPKDIPRHIMVCPDDRYPYPGVFDNKTLSNKNLYPYMPCCFRRNQLISTTSALNRYFNGTVPKQARTTTSRNSHKIKTGKKLEPGRIGYVPSTVASFLRRYDEESGSFYRYGVPRSTNSFIHCVALALDSPIYMTSPDKEAWVNYLRSNLFNSAVGIRPELLRQELYDMNNEDIINVATDNDEFFDPLRFYRILEELFDCNIYVFSNKDEDHETARKISLLQLPRHQYFHAHAPVPGRRVVLISRHWGSEANALEYPQCEIIIDQRQSETRMAFGDDMNELLYPALTFVGRTLSWQIFEARSVSPEGEDVIIPSLTCRMNVYSAMNFKMIFGQIPILRQIIDAAGKARVFEIAPERNSALRIYVNIPPTAPLNIAEFKPEDVLGNLPPYPLLVQLLGEPISVTISTDGLYLTGLWFPVGDIQFGFYCQCQDVLWTEFSQKYPNINRNSESAALTVHIPRKSEIGRGEVRSLIAGSSIQRIKYLRRAARFVDQIVKYLYLVADKPTDIDNFLKSIAIFLPAEQRSDSVDIYNISNIPRILPDGNDVNVILTKLGSYSPLMFFQNRVLIYDKQMLEGITFQLKRFVKDIAGLPVSSHQLRQIQGYYSSKDDFDFNQRFEFILGSLKEFNAWSQIHVPSSNLQQRTIQNLKDSIQTHLNVTAYTYQEPYIYQQSGNNTLSTSYDPKHDRFYLIQNVAIGDLRRAIQVAYNWNKEKRNTGFATEEWPSQAVLATRKKEDIEDRYPIHIIYKISQGGGIMVQQNNAIGFDEYLEVLSYGNNFFAAMLPIL
jgi:hypothetical protein